MEEKEEHGCRREGEVEGVLLQNFDGRDAGQRWDRWRGCWTQWTTFLRAMAASVGIQLYADDLTELELAGDQQRRGLCRRRCR